MESRIVPLLFAAMTNHTDSYEVQAESCAAMGYCVAMTDEAKLMMVEQGGIPLILAGMRNHIQDDSVQQYACRALTGTIIIIFLSYLIL